MAACNNFRTVNCWSKAGVGTCIVLQHASNNNNNNNNTNNGPRIALDLGASPAFDETIYASCVLITHGHIDHIGGIFSHARAHALSCGGGAAATYYVPAQILSLVESAKETMMALDAAAASHGDDDGRKILNMNLVGVTPGDEFILPVVKKKLPHGTQVFVRVFATSHAGCPSVGYALGTRRTKQVLKDEFQGLSGDELRDLARNKMIQLKNQVVEEDLDVAYTGDTTIDGLLRDPEPWCHHHTLFCEATFLDPTDKSRDLARDRGHLHVDDIVRLLREASQNEKIVLMHISDRYNAVQALDFLVQTIPTDFHSKIAVAVSSLNKFSDLRHVAKFGLVELTDYVKKDETTAISEG